MANKDIPRSSKYNSKLRLVLKNPLVVIGLLIAGLIVIVLISHAFHKQTGNDQYCDSFDPTGCRIATNITNNTTSTYTVKQCSDGNVPCKTFAEVATLRPGESHKANGSTDGTPQPWQVYDTQSKLIGCLNLEFTKYQSSPAVANLSDMDSCSTVSSTVSKFKQQYKVF